jgi:hypothetical protein
MILFKVLDQKASKKLDLKKEKSIKHKKNKSTKKITEFFLILKINQIYERFKLNKLFRIKNMCFL